VLDLFAPFQQLLAPAPYDRPRWVRLCSPSRTTRIFGRLDAHGTWNCDLDRCWLNTGKTAIILVSEWRRKFGRPGGRGRNSRSKYGQACFSYYLFGRRAERQEDPEDIAKLDSVRYSQGLEPAFRQSRDEEICHGVFCAPMVAAKRKSWFCAV